MNKKTILSITLVSALSAGAALAEEPRNPSAQAETSALADAPVVPSGWAVQAGGGVTGFTSESTRNGFGTGGYWDARAILGTRSILGAEMAYVGSARQINGNNLAEESQLVGNGAEAVGRVNLPLSAGSLRITPFAFGGVGWTYYQVVNGTFNSALMKEDAHAFVIPFGAGASLDYDHYKLDARFTYRGVFDDDLAAKAGGGHQDLQNWSAGLMAGYEF